MIRFDNIPPEVMQAMCTPMHQILPGAPPSIGSLYVGSMSAVNDIDLLRENQISHLVSVLDVPWQPPSEKYGLTRYQMDVLDTTTEDLKSHLEGACSDIDRALKGGKNVLVHCQQGVSRSPAIVIAYLIRNYNMTYDQAYALLIRKRACIKPNSGFVRALQEYEASRRPRMTRRQTT